MAMAAVPQDRIAKALKTTKTTLEANFREELDLAADQLNAKIVGALFKNAVEGNVAAQIFWCKTRLKWNETIEHTGKDGTPITPVFNITVHKIDGDE